MSQAIVATGHPATSQSAASILQMGGNAVDAAISALLTSCMTEPALSSLGGGGFAMVQMHDSNPVLIDFFAHAPKKLKSAHEVSIRSFICDFGSAQQEFHIGAGTSTVPGTVKGIFELSRNFGRMSMKDLIQPAIDTLKEGITVNELQAKFLDMLSPIYLDPSARPIFESRQNPGETLTTGEKMYCSEYCDLLETLAIEGPDLFYRGEVATLIHKIAEFDGGTVTARDLKNYQAHFRKPLSVSYRNHAVFLNPPPSTGGLLIAMALLLLHPTKPGTFDSPQHVNALLNAMKTINELNEAAPSEIIDKELQRQYFKIRREMLAASRGTTHISVIDQKRNAVALTITNGEGCGTIVPGTGIMLNNMLGEADLNPRGLVDWVPDVRLSSSMAPTIAIRNNSDQVVTGSGGSNRIYSALLQVLVNLIDYQMSVEQAVVAPRVHYHEGAAYLEDLFGENTVETVLTQFEDITRFPECNVFFGGAHTVRSTRSGLEGCADERRSGHCIRIP